MALTKHELLESFDEVMRTPESCGGHDVPETCRLLAELAKRRVSHLEYADTMREFEQLYLDQFLHTRAANPQFAGEIRRCIMLYV